MPRPLGSARAQSPCAGVSGDSALQVVHSARSTGTAWIPYPICHPVDSCQQWRVVSTKPLTFRQTSHIFLKAIAMDERNTELPSKHFFTYKHVMLNYKLCDVWK